MFQSSATVSAAKKRMSHIDETVAPLRLSSKAAASSVPDSDASQTVGSPAPIFPSPDKVGPSEANPFSVKSDDIKNTQRRSTSFLDSIETKGIEKEQKRASVQKSLSEKPAGLTLADFGSKVKLHSVTKTKNSSTKLTTKKPKDKNKKKTGYALWFETQTGMEPKSGPLTWRRLPAEEKEKFLEAAKELEKKVIEPSVSLINSFVKKVPTENSVRIDEKENGEKSEDEAIEAQVTLDSNSNHKPASSDPEVVEEKQDVTEPLLNVGMDSKTDINEDKENVRTSKRRASSESDSEKNPPKSKKLIDPSQASDQTKNKLAAFQFKKKLT